jgi:tetratricopeptide (TPR) repeat protein
LYYDYASLIGASRAENAKVTALLSKAIALKPEYKEARLRLVWALLSDRNWNEALKHLGELKQVDEKLAVSLFRAMAYANFHAGKQEEAVRAADRARQYAKTPEDIQATEELKLLVNQPVAAPLARAETVVRPAPVARRQEAPTEDEDRPRPERKLVNREPAAAESVDPSSSLRKPSTLKIEGALEHFDCMGKIARLRIVAGGKRLSFAILEPASISIAGTGAGTFDFSCGAQKARPVALEYEPKEDKKLGTAGTLRSIEFR